VNASIRTGHKNIFGENIILPESMEEFFLRPMAYLHHELIPEEVKRLRPSVE
jgi:threonyl-tRNA synthetase